MVSTAWVAVLHDAGLHVRDALVEIADVDGLRLRRHFSNALLVPVVLQRDRVWLSVHREGGGQIKAGLPTGLLDSVRPNRAEGERSPFSVWL
jgi:hypothetical protein